MRSAIYGMVPPRWASTNLIVGNCSRRPPIAARSSQGLGAYQHLNRHRQLGVAPQTHLPSGGLPYAADTRTPAFCTARHHQNLQWSVVDGLSSAHLRPWLLPAVYERHQAGLGDFLAELRPAVALFL